MDLRRLGLALLALVALVALAGCGDTTSKHPPSLGQLPLVPGASVLTQVSQCDQGAHRYCAIEAVIVDRRFDSSGAFVHSEADRLQKLGWSTSAGDDGVEAAANSPDQKLRLTFATAVDDLIGLDENWIQRGSAIQPALDHMVFNRTPAMSILLEAGPT